MSMSSARVFEVVASHGTVECTHQLTVWDTRRAIQFAYDLRVTSDVPVMLKRKLTNPNDARNHAVFIPKAEHARNKREAVSLRMRRDGVEGGRLW